MPNHNRVQSLWNRLGSLWGESHRRTAPRGHSSAELENRCLLAAIVAAALTPTAATSIEGRVFGDGNADGKLNGPEQGLGGRKVQLVDSKNVVVKTVDTRPDGSFRFENMPVGSYLVREVLPPGTTSTTPPKPIVIAKDSHVTGILVGEAPPKPVAQNATQTVTIQGALLNSLL